MGEDMLAASSVSTVTLPPWISFEHQTILPNTENVKKIAKNELGLKKV
jgi:hypothetical protein